MTLNVPADWNLIMTDQATSLRDLAMQVAMRDDGRERYGVLGVIGARPGLGTTFVAVNLALALDRLGWPVAVVDADFDAPALHRRCGVRPSSDWSAFLEGETSLRELQRSGPADIKIITGTSIAAEGVEGREHALEQLQEHLPTLAQSRLIIVDFGHAAQLDDCGPAIQELLIVTQTDVECLMDAYARIKRFMEQPTGATIWMVANRVDSTDAAELARQRMVSSCDRFLNLSLRTTTLPEDPQAAEAERPVLLHQPKSELSRAFESLAQVYTHIRRSYGRVLPHGV